MSSFGRRLTSLAECGPEGTTAHASESQISLRTTLPRMSCGEWWGSRPTTAVTVRPNHHNMLGTPISPNQAIIGYSGKVGGEATSSKRTVSQGSDGHYGGQGDLQGRHRMQHISANRALTGKFISVLGVRMVTYCAHHLNRH